MSKVIYLGIDDTDVIGSPGTGKVARTLAGHLEESGIATSLGVSRHQLLVDPRVRYTSHNSCKGLAVTTDRVMAALIEPCVAHIRSCFQAGSDPGLCICAEEQITQEIIEFGQMAKTTVLTKQQAVDLAARNSIFLRELGGDGGGVIGALAAVGLRAAGNDGRLNDIRGIREITGLVSVGELKRRTDIVSVQDTGGRYLGDDQVVDSMDWVRPSLIGGRPVLRVKSGRDAAGRQLWVPAEKRLKDAGKGDMIVE